MNNIGKAGTLRTPPQPRENVIAQALALMAAFGSGDEDLRALLKEMQSVQSNNEALLADARITLEKAEVALQRESDLLQREARLEQRETEFNRILAETKATFA